MRWFLNIFIVFLVIVLQTVIFPKAPLWGIIPNLALIVVVCWSILRGEEGLYWAFVLGLIFDLIGGVYFGLWTFAFLIISFLILLLSEELLQSYGILSFSVLICFSTLIFDSLYLATLNLLGFKLPLKFIFSHQVIKEIFINLVIGLLIFIFISKYSELILFWENQAKLPEKIRR